LNYLQLPTVLGTDYHDALNRIYRNNPCVDLQGNSQTQ
jgi:hypothetical protein